MENLYKWIADGWAKNKGGIIISLIVALIAWLGPKIWNRSETAVQQQIQLIRQENADCKTYAGRIQRANDSLRSVIQQMNDDKVKDLQKQNAALRAANDKYNEAMLKTRNAVKTIDNIQKTVNNEIK